MKQDILSALDKVLDERKQANPTESYTAKLYDEGVDSILKKVGEEASEVIIASKSGEHDAIIHEVADLWFHTLVLLKHHGLATEDILSELSHRFGLSGLEEKANRNK
ncbi:MAG: phosphoribosyl-ATP diphosphatase [Proteobacteria bacterium]|nr:phosphoribosyl-ATP diphosphatase [Pseudomonadota bacterium]